MTTESYPIWHYGLMAERWAEFLHETPELPFLKETVARYGQPVLDLACGTGRLLLPLLRVGFEVDGCDVSGDMLARCRQAAEREGLTLRLYQQPMHALSLDRKYRVIYIVGSFGLGGNRDDDLETLRRCYAHLEPGGALLVNIQAEWTAQDSWDTWLTEKVRSLPEPWPERGEGRIASDGSEHFAQFRTIKREPLEQRYTRQVRLSKYRDAELIAQEEYTLTGNMYLPEEVRLMLKVAGFRDIALFGDYKYEPANEASEELIFVAVRR